MTRFKMNLHLKLYDGASAKTVLSIHLGYKFLGGASKGYLTRMNQASSIKTRQSKQ